MEPGARSTSLRQRERVQRVIFSRQPHGEEKPPRSLPLPEEISALDFCAGLVVVVRRTLAAHRVETNQVTWFELAGADVVDVLSGHASKFACDGADQER
ncbi:hypothetical protein E4U12_004248 [Claviceps purpurea]|nr:hypothetical protein E4U12_004248 [Claviceps purpurea]